MGTQNISTGGLPQFPSGYGHELNRDTWDGSRAYLLLLHRGNLIGEQVRTIYDKKINMEGGKSRVSTTAGWTMGMITISTEDTKAVLDCGSRACTTPTFIRIQISHPHFPQNISPVVRPLTRVDVTYPNLKLDSLNCTKLGCSKVKEKYSISLSPN